MNKRFAGELAAQLDTKVRVEGTALHAVLQHGDAFVAVRMRGEPYGEVFAATRPLDGFEHTIRWGDRWRDPTIGDHAFDAAFGLSTNDPALLREWLDPTSRKALVDSLYEFQTEDVSMPEALGLSPGDVGWHAAHTKERTWTYELRDDELAATKGTIELNPALLARAARTAAALVARTQRWTAAYAVLARSLGGSAHGTLALGGGPIITVSRDAVDLGIRVLRRPPHAEPGLRTVIAAPRGGSREGTLALVNPRAHRVALPDGKRRPDVGDYQLRATSDELAAGVDTKLVALVDPAAIAIDADSVQLWLDGAPMEHARLDAAVALVVRLARGSVVDLGPYR